MPLQQHDAVRQEGDSGFVRQMEGSAQATRAINFPAVMRIVAAIAKEPGSFGIRRKTEEASGAHSTAQHSTAQPLDPSL